ncbi:SDR family NAD(P)-dependent oxidoreductase [Synechococcus elongatus IITB7]|uniref:SDR family NAD(P)-dependent oxidoreductase n=1 Tax=Synechococcus elongatus TaxID=32046 RepID=UPI0030CE8746
MYKHHQSIEKVFVLGSTSTVAAAICRLLAQRGCQHFHLVARNDVANQQLASELQERYGAEVSLESCDLLSPEFTHPSQLPALARTYDLYLIAAGALGEAEQARQDPAEAWRITAANYSGLLPWLTAICTPERLRQPGRLWVFSSVAADRGRPSNYHYGAAKAALTTFCEGLQLRCQGKPFAVRIIKAGFMASPMTQGKAPAILCASPESVAKALLRRPNRRGIEYLPWWWSPIMALIRCLPPSLACRL